MKTCPDCGALISDQAAACPNCADLKAGPAPAAQREKTAAASTPGLLFRILKWVAAFLLFWGSIGLFVIAASHSEAAGYITLSVLLAGPVLLELRRPGRSLLAVFIFLLFFGGCGFFTVPKFSDLLIKRHSSANLGGLSSVRSAIQVYYGDNGGSFPTDLGVLTPGYLPDGLPVVDLPGHGRSRAVQYLSDLDSRAGLFSDAGGWAYTNSPADRGTWGNVVINCTHPRAPGAGPGSPWTSF